MLQQSIKTDVKKMILKYDKNVNKIKLTELCTEVQTTKNHVQYS